MPFPTTIEQLRNTEARLGRKLPLSYFGGMLEENGGVVETKDDDWSLHPVFDDSDRTRLKRTCNDVVRETESAKAWAGFPEGAVAIAANGSGDLLLFLPAPSTDKLDGRVFAWDHETGNLEVVADDFAALTKRSA